MRKLFILILFFLLVENIYSQQLPLSSQYMFNKFLINPAATGSSEDIEIRLTARSQWTGLNGSPKTQNISANKLLNNKTMGVGLSLFSDKYGPETKVGFKLSYSYIIPISGIKSNLAFGLAFHGFQYSINYNELVAISPEDPILQSNGESSFVPDADFGIYLYNKKYSFGISANQLIEMPVEIGGVEQDKNTMVRHYYIIGTYLINLNDNFNFEPSVLVKATEITPIQADINFRFIYKNDYWAAVSYRTSSAIIAMIGIKYNHFIIGYSYDYDFNEIQQFQSGSHEIILGYNFGQHLMSNSMLNSIRSF